MSLTTVNKQETVKQSTDAFRQWKDQWIANAKENGKRNKEQGHDILDLMKKFHKRLCVIVATGASLENHIDTLKKYQDKPGVDIVTNDKSFKVLMDHGIKPRVVIVSDAVVSYEDWAEPYIDQTTDVIMIGSVTCNPKWGRNWKGPSYFFVSKDSIKTEDLMAEVSGISRTLPAAANVGNTSIVLAANILQPSEILLVGFDYSWKPGQSYYAFSEKNSEDKRFWQKHEIMVGIDGEITYGSANLTFAGRWLKNFYTTISSGVNKSALFNCSGQGIVDVPVASLSERLERFKFEELTEVDKHEINRARVRSQEFEKANDFREFFKENNVYSAVVNYVPRPVTV